MRLKVWSSSAAAEPSANTAPATAMAILMGSFINVFSSRRNRVFAHSAGTKVENPAQILPLDSPKTPGFRIDFGERSPNNPAYTGTWATGPLFQGSGSQYLDGVPGTRAIKFRSFEAKRMKKLFLTLSLAF